jgi:hypothetical protein
MNLHNFPSELVRASNSRSNNISIEAVIMQGGRLIYQLSILQNGVLHRDLCRVDGSEGNEENEENEKSEGTDRSRYATKRLTTKCVSKNEESDGSEGVRYATNI